MEEKMEPKDETKQYRRCRLREHYTCIKTQVSLQKSDVVDVLDDQQEKMWLVRHCTDKQKVFSHQVLYTAMYNYFNHRVGRIWNALPCDAISRHSAVFVIV